MLETNRIYLGDCLEVMQGISDNSIDMVLADLPYGSTTRKWDAVIPFDALWQQYKRIIKPNGAVVLTAKQPFTSFLVCSNVEWLREHLVWIKHRATNFVQGKLRHLNYTEDVLVFGGGVLTYNPQMQKRESSRLEQMQNGKSKNWNSNGKSDDVVFTKSYAPREWTVYDAKLKLPMNYLIIPAVVSNSKEKTKHPTQKPVALFEYLVRTYTNKHELVLDNCAGSGTTGVACLNTNRNFILIEKEQEYFDIAQQRLQKVKQEIQTNQDEYIERNMVLMFSKDRTKKDLSK